MRKLLYLSVALNIAFVLFFIGKRVYYSGSSNMLKKYSWAPTAAYNEIKSKYDADKSTCSITFIGDSHVEFGQWSELLGRPVCNRGIRGEITEALSRRLDHVTGDTCYILIGINDILNHIPLDKITANYGVVINSLKPKVLYTIQVPKVSNSLPDYSRINRRVDELNTWLKGNSRLISFDITEADLLPDGVHLKSSGYTHIANGISQVQK